eukprot:14224732-Alexandrium_andersonii.AAC.1
MSASLVGSEMCIRDSHLRVRIYPRRATLDHCAKRNFQAPSLQNLLHEVVHGRPVEVDAQVLRIYPQPAEH